MSKWLWLCQKLINTSLTAELLQFCYLLYCKKEYLFALLQNVRKKIDRNNKQEKLMV